MIFNRRSIKAGARTNLARWYQEVEKSGFDSFNTIAATLYDRNDEILNFYINRASNAAAESFNAKIKFLYLICKTYNEKSLHYFSCLFLLLDYQLILSYEYFLC